MRKLLLLALVLCPWTVRADSTWVDVDSFVVDTIYKVSDSVLALCKERGHVKAYDFDNAVTCLKRTVDLPGKTIQVETRTGQISRCWRCGAIYESIPPPCTTVIWQKPDTTLPLRGGDDGIYWQLPIWHNPADLQGPVDTVLLPIEDSLDANR